MTPEKQAALDEYQRSVEAYTNRKLNKFNTQGDLFNYEQGQSGINDIQTDPRYKEHELTALRDLEDQSRNGFTAKDQADITRVENQANRAHAGRAASIVQNMHARGMGGGGLDLAAQLQSSQDANEMAALRGLEQEGMMQDRKRSATRDLGQMAGNMQQRDFGQQAQKAQAQDQINQFNINNRNRANQWNMDNTQHVADQNTAAANQQGAGNFEAQSGLAKVHYNSAQDEINQQLARKEASERKRKGMIGGVLGAAGGVAGGVIGIGAGPAGSMLGATVGAQAGSALGNSFSHGGYIPGDANESGDSPANDTENVNLSPGELVIPRSIAGNPKLAAKYAKHMAHLKEIVGAKHGHGNNYAQGGYIEPNAEPDMMPDNTMPDDTMPGQETDSGFNLGFDSSKQDRMDPEERAKFEAHTKGMSPLIKSYLEDRVYAKKDSADAGKAQTMAGFGNVAGKLFTDFQNSQKPVRVTGNKWDNMGDSAKVFAEPDKVWDSKPLDQFGDRAAKNASDKYKIAQGGLDKALDRNDKALDREARAADRQQYYDMATTNARALNEGRNIDREQRGTENNLNRQIRQDSLAQHKDEAKAKRDESAGELNVPGYDRTGEVTQTKTEAEKARSAMGTADTVLRGIDTLKAQMKEHGNFEWGGKGGAAMDATATDLRLQLKELANLGVLSGPDYALMLKQIPDTTSLGQMFTRNDTTNSQLDSVTESIKRRVEASMKAKGYMPNGGGAKPKGGTTVLTSADQLP